MIQRIQLQIVHLTVVEADSPEACPELGGL
jgi:hypothetical protein